MNEPQYISVWSECLKMIRDVIPPTSFKTWFEPLKAVKLEEKTLTLEVPSDFVREYLEEHYINYISRALKREIGSDAKLMYKVRVVKNDTVTLPHQDSQQITNKSVPYPQNGSGINNPFIIPGLKQLNINPQLNPSYSFNNFVEGECNRLARAAGLSIADNPGSNAFNPLLIYGGPGLGKTHLAQAIGIAIKEKYPDKIVLYISANRFQTQYMDAVNIKNKLTDFLHFYMMMDVLIIDDVHEFAEKPGTQNAFFQIFNHLYSSVNAVASSFWRVSAARVQLNRLTIAYTLPKAWIKHIGINSARVNVTGQDLINFYNPYPDNFTSPMAGTYGNYPNLRKFTVGVNLSF